MKAVAAVSAEPQFAPHLADASELWNYAGPKETEARLRAAGFSEARCWLEPRPVKPPDPLRFTMTSTLGAHLARLPEALRRRFAEAVIERSYKPLTLDYIRLNIEARAAPQVPKRASPGRHV